METSRFAGAFGQAGPDKGLVVDLDAILAALNERPESRGFTFREFQKAFGRSERTANVKLNELIDDGKVKPLPVEMHRRTLNRAGRASIIPTYELVRVTP